MDSKEGEGSCFTVEFLKGKEHYTENVEFILSDSVEMKPEEVEESVRDMKRRGMKAKRCCWLKDNLELSFLFA